MFSFVHCFMPISSLNPAVRWEDWWWEDSSCLCPVPFCSFSLITDHWQATSLLCCSERRTGKQGSCYLLGSDIFHAEYSRRILAQDIIKRRGSFLWNWPNGQHNIDNFQRIVRYESRWPTLYLNKRHKDLPIHCRKYYDLLRLPCT